MPTFGPASGLGTSVESGEIADAAVTNAKIAAGTSAQVLMSNATPATAWTSLAGDVTVGATGTMAIASDVVVNADVNTAAAIAYSKLAALTSAQILVGNGSNVPTAVAVTGDVTISNSGVTAIGASKVTEAMHVMADNTTNNSSASAHGFMPKLSNVLSDIIGGTGLWRSDRGLVGGGSSGTTTSGSEVEIATVSFTNVTAATDLMLVRVWCTGSGGTGPVALILRVTDGTGTSNTSLAGATVVTDYNTYDVIIQQSTVTNSELLGHAVGMENTTAATDQIRTTGFAANWMGNGNVFTVSLRGNINTGTLHAGMDIIFLSRGAPGA